MNNYQLSSTLKNHISAAVASAFADEIETLTKVLKDAGLDPRRGMPTDPLCFPYVPEGYTSISVHPMDTRYIAVLPDGTEMLLETLGVSMFNRPFSFFPSKNPPRYPKVHVSADVLPKLETASNVAVLLTFLFRNINECSQEELSHLSPLIPKLFDSIFESWKSTRRLTLAFLGKEG